MEYIHIYLYSRMLFRWDVLIGSWLSDGINNTKRSDHAYIHTHMHVVGGGRNIVSQQ